MHIPPHQHQATHQQITDIGHLLLRLYLVKCHNKWFNKIWIFTKAILQSGDGN